MANQVIVTANNTVQVAIEPTPNVEVTISRTAIGTVANVPTANYANFAGSATTAATVTANAQPNITSVGNLTGLTSTGNITAPYFLGNVVGNISGNIVVPGLQGDVLFNNAGSAGADGNLNYDVANSTLNVTGTINATNISGNGSQLTDINGSNVTGTVANANFANDSANANIANVAYSVDVANVVGIGNVATINLDGNVANALLGDGTWGAVELDTANYASYAGNVTVNAQPNITSVGTLTGLTVNTNAASLITSTNANIGSTVIDTANTNTGLNYTHFNNVVYNQTYLSLTSAGFNFYIGNTTPGNVGFGNIKSLWNFQTNGNLTHTFGGTGNLNAKGANLGTGNLTAGRVTASGNVQGNVIVANYFYGEGGNISNIQGANVSGIVANANYAANAGYAANAAYADSANLATYANIVIDNAQPNITSVGTLTALNANSNSAIVLRTNNANIGFTVVDSANTSTGLNFTHFNNVVYNQTFLSLTASGMGLYIANTAPGSTSPSNIKSFWNFQTNGNLTHTFGGTGNVNAKGLAVGTGNITGGNATIATNIIAGNITANNTVTGNVITSNSIVNANYISVNSNIISIDGLNRSLILNGQGSGSNNISALNVNNGTVSVNMDNVPAVYASFQFATYEDTNGFINPYTFYRARGNSSSPNNTQAGDAVKAEYYNAYGDSGNTYVPLGSTVVTVKNNDNAGNVSSLMLLQSANTNDGSEINLLTDIIRLDGNITTPYTVDINSNISLYANGRMDYLRTFGSFTSNATQTSNGANTTNYMTLNNTEDANGISIANSTEITVARPGRYNIQFSAQLEKTDSGSDLVEIWLVKNGNGVANSATQLRLTGNGAKDVAAWDFNVDAANVNDYFEIAWASPDTNVQLTAIDTANTISGIAVPSVILDINPVGA